jgi:GNAT superfamily N-acetyltransferase
MTRTVRSALHPRGRLVPAVYPRRFECNTTLRDGRRVVLRPIVPEDTDALRQAVAEADAETLHNRFLGGRPPQTDEEFARLASVDYDRRFAVVALSPDGRGVGIARYEALHDGGSAEVAVAIDPAWRRVGLATALLHLLGVAALDNGIERFSVEFLLANVDVTTLLTESHLPVVVRQHHGVAEAEVNLTAVIGDTVQSFADTVPP